MPSTLDDTSRTPFEQIAVDLMEMPLTARGNCYAIVFLDYLTKWVEAYALPNRTSEM